MKHQDYNRRKKVLFLTTLFPDKNKQWLGIFLKKMAIELSKIGHEVNVLVLIKANKKDIQFIKEESIKILYYTHIINRFENIIPGIRKGKYLDIVKTCNNYIDLSNTDIIHIHFTDICIWNLIKSIPGLDQKKVFIHYHGLFQKPINIKSSIIMFFKALASRKIIKKASALIGVSEKVSIGLRERYKRKRVLTIYNGVDTNIFFPFPKKPGKTIKICCVGNLLETKGQNYLIQAVRDCIYKLPEYRIILNTIGSGPKEKEYKDLVNQLNISDHVNFIKEKNHSEIAEFLRESDIFVLPSYFEALGCVYLEAMATRIPAIGCRGQGISEIIKNGENGFLVSPKSVKELVETINILVLDPDKRKEIAANGYKTVVNNYTWEKTAKFINNLYGL